MEAMSKRALCGVVLTCFMIFSTFVTGNTKLLPDPRSSSWQPNGCEATNRCRRHLANEDGNKNRKLLRDVNNMEQQESTISVSVIWRGKKFIVEMSLGAALKEFGHELQKLTGVKADTMRLIVPQSSNKSSKLLSLFADEHSRLSLQETSILEGKSIRLMGASEDEVDEVVKNAKGDLRIAGFDEEEKRMRQRMMDKPHASLKLPQGTYIFCDFRTLQIPGIELNPPPSEALKRMHMLAADPEIVAIMNKHRWSVGIMTEMAPEGYVGVSPKCILGFNKNHGEEISLRLRTDDLKGFRKYESIKKTLLHELAHMVYSEHDANFYALDKQGAEAKNVPAAAELYKKANDICGFDLLDVCFNGPKEKLDSTVKSQPAIYVTSLAAVEVLRAREGGQQIIDSVDVTCGLSLGECTALAFAGAFSFEDGLELVELRGEAMQEASDAAKSAMVCFIGLDSEKVQLLCDAANEEVDEDNKVQIAKFLCPGNYAVSGGVKEWKQ